MGREEFGRFENLRWQKKWKMAEKIEKTGKSGARL